MLTGEFISNSYSNFLHYQRHNKQYEYSFYFVSVEIKINMVQCHSKGIILLILHISK